MDCPPHLSSTQATRREGRNTFLNLFSKRGERKIKSTPLLFLYAPSAIFQRAAEGGEKPNSIWKKGELAF